MKIPIFILTAAVSSILAMQAWIMLTLVKYGEDIAAIKATISLRDTAQR